MPIGKKNSAGRVSDGLSAEEKALCCARLAFEKKAHQLVVLHTGIISSIAEYFVICSGRSVRQTRAIAGHIHTQLKRQHQQIPLGVEGEKEGFWILMDYDEIVVHIFDEPTRELFSLEKIWNEAPRVEDPGLCEEEALNAQGFGREDDDWED